LISIVFKPSKGPSPTSSPWREKLKGAVMEVETSTPEALRGAWVARDVERYGKLVRDVGRKAE
jgi:hypothetical protein